MPQVFPSNLGSQLFSAWYRLQFYADFRSVARILRYRTLRKRYYEHFWQEIGSNFGADVQSNNFGFTQIKKDGWVTYVKEYQMMFDSYLMLQIMGNKPFTYKLLADFGAPVIPHLSSIVLDLDAAKRFLATHQKVVVKPSSGTGGGRGVTTGITSVDQLKAAAKLASRFDRDLLIEKQVQGNSFRLLFLDGVLIDAIRRDPPIVRGDGKSSIKKLVKMENRRRENNEQTSALSPLVIDRDAKNWLKSKNLNPSSIPAPGQVMQVKLATNENNKYGNVNITKNVSTAISSNCSQLVKKIGVKFAGVDLICHDIAGDFTAENCFVGEINTTPGLHHHYLIANPEDGNPVAELALQYLLENRIGIIQPNKNEASLNLPPKYSQEAAKLKCAVSSDDDSKNCMEIA